MIILYKNAARVNYFTEVDIQCSGGSKHDVEANTKVIPYDCANAEVPCTAKLREITGGMVGKEIDAELYIRGDKGEMSWKKQDTVFMFPSFACSLKVQVCTKERSNTIKKPFCLCFSSKGVIIAKSEAMCILSKPPNIHKLPFAKITEGSHFLTQSAQSAQSSTCSTQLQSTSPSRWIAGYSPETHTYTALEPVQEIKVWKTQQHTNFYDYEMSAENERLRKRLKTMEVENHGLIEALRVLKSALK
jgi:hypothetical protein